MKYVTKRIIIEAYCLGDMNIPIWLKQAIHYNIVKDVKYNDEYKKTIIEASIFESEKFTVGDYIIQLPDGALICIDSDEFDDKYEPFKEPTLTTSPNIR